MPSITVLDTRPTYITPSEHAALSSSTPSSFSDIPTVVRHVEEGVRVVIEPPEAIAKLGIQEEKLRHGTLLVLERFVLSSPHLDLSYKFRGIILDRVIFFAFL